MFRELCVYTLNFVNFAPSIQGEIQRIKGKHLWIIGICNRNCTFCNFQKVYKWLEKFFNFWASLSIKVFDFSAFSLQACQWRIVFNIWNVGIGLVLRGLRILGYNVRTGNNELRIFLWRIFEAVEQLQTILRDIYSFESSNIAITRTKSLRCTRRIRVLTHGMNWGLSKRLSTRKMVNDVHKSRFYNTDFSRV